MINTRERVYDYIVGGMFIVLMFIGFMAGRCSNLETPVYNPPPVVNIEVETLPKFFNQRPQEGLKEALEYYEIKCPDIVYKQALLETGRFKSGGCTKDNNLFGIMFNGKHAKFNHWTESVVAYRDYIQYRYKDNEDYYSFLKRIGYATDKEYINKLKKLE